MQRRRLRGDAVEAFSTAKSSGEKSGFTGNVAMPDADAIAVGTRNDCYIWYIV